MLNKISLCTLNFLQTLNLIKPRSSDDSQIYKLSHSCCFFVSDLVHFRLCSDEEQVCCMSCNLLLRCKKNYVSI